MAFLILPTYRTFNETVLDTSSIESVQFYYHVSNKTGVITIFSKYGAEPIKYQFQDKEAEYNSLKQRILKALEAKEL